ncbi:hypothetical protein D3C75_803140 [compost metagenome]
MEQSPACLAMAETDSLGIDILQMGQNDPVPEQPECIIHDFILLLDIVPNQVAGIKDYANGAGGDFIEYPAHFGRSRQRMGAYAFKSEEHSPFFRFLGQLLDRGPESLPAQLFIAVRLKFRKSGQGPGLRSDHWSTEHPGIPQMLLEPFDLQPAGGRIGMNRINVTAKHTDADSRPFKLFADIIGKARAKLPGRGIDILYCLG